jgi:kanamycin nucleotidyltransferase
MTTIPDRGAAWLDGATAKPRAQRRALGREIADRARVKFRAVAVGFYGSIARDADGPYSDIEILCVTGDAPDQDWEWLHDGWSIDVNVRNRASVLEEATTVPGNWSISHANYLYVAPVYDPDGFFGELIAAMEAVPTEKFDRAIADVLSHLYGATSKLRNARHNGTSPSPGFLHYVVALGCNMIGLANRHAYSTAHGGGRRIAWIAGSLYRL